MWIGVLPLGNQVQLFCYRQHSYWKIKPFIDNEHIIVVLLQLELSNRLKLLSPNYICEDLYQTEIFQLSSGIIVQLCLLGVVSFQFIYLLVFAVQDTGWQCVLLGNSKTSFKSPTPMSYGNSESDANQPSQELAYPIKSGGVPLLPDLNTHTGGEKRKKKKSNWQTAQLLKLAKHFKESSNFTAFMLKTLQVLKSYLK